jgi:hypothetical protein
MLFYFHGVLFLTSDMLKYLEGGVWDSVTRLCPLHGKCILCLNTYV